MAVGVWTAPEGTFTIEEFKRLPLERRRWELLNGKVVQMEPHGLETSARTASLTFAIDRRSRDLDLGIVLGAGCGFRSWHGQETVRVTDVSFTRYDRLSADRDPHDYPRWAPDLIAEVVSPFEKMATVLERIAMFLRAGTRLVWLAEPASHTVTIVGQDAILPALGMGGILDGGEVLPELNISIAEIFS